MTEPTTDNDNGAGQGAGIPVHEVPPPAPQPTISDDHIITSFPGGAVAIELKTFAPPPVPVDCSAMIDIGSFFDRFGPLRFKILASDDVMVRAIVRDAQARKWIQLDHPDTAQAVRLISETVPELTAEIIAHVLATPVHPEENLALRRLYFPGS